MTDVSLNFLVKFWILLIDTLFKLCDTLEAPLFEWGNFLLELVVSNRTLSQFRVHILDSSDLTFLDNLTNLIEPIIMCLIAFSDLQSNFADPFLETRQFLIKLIMITFRLWLLGLLKAHCSFPLKCFWAGFHRRLSLKSHCFDYIGWLLTLKKSHTSTHLLIWLALPLRFSTFLLNDWFYISWYLDGAVSTLLQADWLQVVWCLVREVLLSRFVRLHRLNALAQWWLLAQLLLS